nr:uncharacterized protein LOC129263398 [Lytechinus pictus]
MPTVPPQGVFLYDFSQRFRVEDGETMVTLDQEQLRLRCSLANPTKPESQLRWETNNMETVLYDQVTTLEDDLFTSHMHLDVKIHRSDHGKEIVCRASQKGYGVVPMASLFIQVQECKLGVLRPECRANLTLNQVSQVTCPLVIENPSLSEGSAEVTPTFNGSHFAVSLRQSSESLGPVLAAQVPDVQADPTEDDIAFIEFVCCENPTSSCPGVACSGKCRSTILHNPTNVEIVRLSDGTLAEYAQNISVLCLANGYPPPSVSWVKQEVTDQENGEFESTTGIGSSTLFFKHLLRGHSGIYGCHADNGIPPSAESLVNIVVNR